MAKTKATEGLTPAELTEVQTLQALAAQDDSVDARVAAAIPYLEPVAADGGETPTPLTPTGQWVKDATDAQAVYGAGNPISPDLLKTLVNRALAIIAPLETE